MVGFFIFKNSYIQGEERMIQFNIPSPKLETTKDSKFQYTLRKVDDKKNIVEIIIALSYPFLTTVDEEIENPEFLWKKIQNP